MASIHEYYSRRPHGLLAAQGAELKRELGAIKHRFQLAWSARFASSMLARAIRRDVGSRLRVVTFLLLRHSSFNLLIFCFVQDKKCSFFAVVFKWLTFLQFWLEPHAKIVFKMDVPEFF